LTYSFCPGFGYGEDGILNLLKFLASKISGFKELKYVEYLLKQNMLTFRKICQRVILAFPVIVNPISRAMAFYRNKMSGNKGAKPKILPY